MIPKTLGGVSREMVRTWRVRFQEGRLDGLADAPRPGAPRKITDEQVEVLVTWTLTEKGCGQDRHWSTRPLAAETGLSQSSGSLTCVSMSYDMFVQAFDAGDAAPMPSSAFDVFRPHADRVQPEYHRWHVRTPDGGEADIYADVTPGTFDSLMISRFSAGDPLDLLAEFTIRAGAVILAPDGPAMLTAEAQREHLPGEFRKDAIVVRNGDDIRQALATS